MFNVLFFWQIESDFLACVDLIYVVSHRETIKYMNNMSGNHELEDETQKKQGAPYCWVSVKQFSKNDTATACQDWLRSTRLGRGSIKSHVRTVKVLGMGLFAFQERIHLWKGVTH